MFKGKIFTTAALITSALLITGVSGCRTKPAETTGTSAVHTTWVETTPKASVTTTAETTSETTEDPLMIRQAFEGTWMGVVKTGKSNVFYTLVFNTDGTGFQSCAGKTQSFRYSDPDTGKKTIKITPETGDEYKISYFAGEYSSNKTFTFSSGMIVPCEIPSVECLRIRSTDPQLIGTWVTGKGKKAKTMVFRENNTMTDKNGSAPYTIEQTFDGRAIIRTLNGDIRYTIEGNTLILETNNTDIEKEWTKKVK